MNFALYIALFPQLIAGPIVRYEDIEPQLAQRKVSARKLGQGARMFLIGLAKKAVLADTFQTVFEEISAISASNLSVPMAWIGCITYAFEIYYDFSGYSDMAIGLSRMFGFELKKNFDHPYVSRSVTEFWRRWHISLSTWFREYVYIPLGGNHCSGGRHILNLLIVWTLTGMWHGAAWNFIVWGFYYGVLLVMENMYGVQKWTGCRHRSEESIRQSACWSAGSSSLVRAWEQPSVILEQWSEQGAGCWMRGQGMSSFPTGCIICWRWSECRHLEADC